MREDPSTHSTITPQTRRLHVSPLTPCLLPTILPPHILQHATNVSYHEIQTFPERNYGYVTLPVMDAEKITKKLNGSILKGSKMKVGEARPEKSKRKLAETVAEEDEERLQQKKKKKARKTKAEVKSKQEGGVLPGVELPKERKVKRGWTDAEAETGLKGKDRKEKKQRKAKAKSNYTNEPELLFKTTLPPNAVPVSNGTSSKKKEKDKKHKKGKADREVVVHEFANTTKQPAFLRDSHSADRATGTAEYVDGKGWIDSTGAVIEAVPKKVQKSPKDRSREIEPAKAPTSQHPTNATSTAKSPPEDESTSSSGSSSPSSHFSSSSS